MFLPSSLLTYSLVMMQVSSQESGHQPLPLTCLTNSHLEANIITLSPSLSLSLSL
ncbi:hypothetical protein BT93_D1931 [Corymbia citriodora subsp. variegata]|nr:hypothetical protein BT93_D1931 [Corymbia citriodora subsp. variegata]